MDSFVQKLLNDKLYDKRKQGALELEKIVREAVERGDHEKIKTIIDNLCNEYTYFIHQPNARNGGLIGLAAASIALGSEGVASHLHEIVPPVLSCFNDQDARVRYYACESMYNISKVAKGEILPYFNKIFDSLSKLASDSEPSVKNGAELLDRLVKDIVSESASSYVSILETHEKESLDSPERAGSPLSNDEVSPASELPTAFSLDKFMPLLQERLHVLNPYTRNFLVSWIVLLDTIPDLELVHYLPAFLGGLFKFLSDPKTDVHNSTQSALERFLSEIKKIAKIKKGIALSRRDQESPHTKESEISSISGEDTSSVREQSENAIVDSESDSADEVDELGYDDWVPGQDVQVDHPKILQILVDFVDTAFDEEIQLTALRWIDDFFEISPEDILSFVPSLLAKVLPALASGSTLVREAATRVNNSLMQYIVTLSEDQPSTAPRISTSRVPVPTSKSSGERRPEADPQASAAPTPVPTHDLDYAAAVGSLTLQFLNENEATRVAALHWLIMLHRRAPDNVLAFHDGTFPALLKTLSDPSDAVVTRDLQLLSQISRNSEDSYFSSFMVSLLQLFSTDRKLLENRGNLIIRQLCTSLSPERIYRTLADCLEKEEDIEFASIMVQNLNNNLITAPELADLRKRLRNLETKDGQMFFVALFRSWCHNAVSTFSLCLLAQAYEQAYNLLQLFAELEMTVNMLIQIDKLVQLLESPVFTYLRLQLLEPDRYPYLYKCLYGVLMLLPQSSAFAALKNRLNSVNISLLQSAPRGTTTPAYERPPARLKNIREDSFIKWGELLDKFKLVQERSRRISRNGQHQLFDGEAPSPHSGGTNASPGHSLNRDRALPDVPSKAIGGTNGNAGGSTGGLNRTAAGDGSELKPKGRSTFSNIGRLGIGQRKQKR